MTSRKSMAGRGHPGSRRRGHVFLYVRAATSSAHHDENHIEALALHSLDYRLILTWSRLCQRT